MADEAPFLRIDREDDYTLTLWGANKRRTTYYKSRGRALPLTLNEIQIIQSASVYDQYRRVSDALPPLRTQIAAIATIEDYYGISVLGCDTATVSQMSVSIFVPTESQIRNLTEWTTSNSRQAPTETAAILHFKGKDDNGPDLWELECWLPPDKLNPLVAWLIEGQLVSLRIGISGDDLYLDDVYDESNSSTNWKVKPLMVEPPAVQSIGSIVFISTTLAPKSLSPPPKTDAIDSKDSVLSDSFRVFVESQSSLPAQFSSFSKLLEDIAQCVRGVVRIQILLTALVFVALLLIFLR